MYVSQTTTGTIAFPGHTETLRNEETCTNTNALSYNVCTDSQEVVK